MVMYLAWRIQWNKLIYLCVKSVAKEGLLAKCAIVDINRQAVLLKKVRVFR